MRRALFAAVIVLVPLSAAADDLPRTAGDGWIDLLKGGPDTPWRRLDKGWIVATDVTLAPDMPNRLKATPGAGPIWVNGETGRLPNLITKATYRDIDVHLEFLLAKRSNGGIKFHAVYEIQLLDSHGKPDEKLTGSDCGGIYPRARLEPPDGYLDKGVPPRVNAAKPAGEWQTLDVTFRSPRLDAKGEKTENAKIVKAVLNDKVIHENVELKTPTGSNWAKKEAATGPFMIQTDHGPLAIRNVRIREMKNH